MKIDFPHTKAEASALVAKLGDYLDGTPDEHFDAQTALKRAGAAFADDWQENTVIFVLGIAAGVLLAMVF